MAEDNKQDPPPAGPTPAGPSPVGPTPADPPPASKKGTREIIPTAAIQLGREAAKGGRRGRQKQLPIGKRVRVTNKDAERYLALGVAKLPDDEA